LKPLCGLRQSPTRDHRIQGWDGKTGQRNEDDQNQDQFK